jgi:hypothetical protein
MEPEAEQPKNGGNSTLIEGHFFGTPFTRNSFCFLAVTVLKSELKSKGITEARIFS